MLKLFKIAALILVLTVKAQLNPYKMFKIRLPSVNSTKISSNGELYFGGHQCIQKYSADYKFIKQKCQDNTGDVVDSLITVSEYGKIVKRNLSTLQEEDNLETQGGVVSADSILNRLAVNYGTKILEFKIQQKIQQIWNYKSNFGSMNDISYSKYSEEDEKRLFIYAVTDNFKLKFITQSSGSYFVQTPISFRSIDSHPKKQHQILIDRNQKIWEVDKTQYYTTYTDNYCITLEKARYSLDGQNVFSVNQKNGLVVWEDQKVTSLNSGWEHQIADISENKDYLCVVDSHGNVGILRKGELQNQQVNILALSIIALVIFVSFVVLVAIQLTRQKRKYAVHEQILANSFRDQKVSQLSEQSM